MSTVINPGNLTLSNTAPKAGDVVTVTWPGITATATVVHKLAVTLSNDDGTTTQLFSADVPTVDPVPLHATAITLDGTPGTIAADGLSASFIAR